MSAVTFRTGISLVLLLPACVLLIVFCVYPDCFDCLSHVHTTFTFSD